MYVVTQYVLLAIGLAIVIFCFVNIVLMLKKHGAVALLEVCGNAATIVLLLMSAWLPFQNHTLFTHGPRFALLLAAGIFFNLPAFLRWAAKYGKPKDGQLDTRVTPSPPGGGHRNAVKIIATPLGEAPLEIREAWVGLVLPLAVQGQQRAKSLGLFSTPETLLGVRLRLLITRPKTLTGYAVNSAKAIEILARAYPEAADWWWENVPHLIGPRRWLVFDTGACEEVPEVVWPPAPTSTDALPAKER